MASGTPDAESLDALVSRAAAGQRQAQNVLLSQYWPIIRDVVRARLSQAVRSIGADDITQDAAIRLLERLPTFRGKDGRAFAAWVRAIAESALIDQVRRDRATKRGRRITQQLEEEPGAPVTRSAESQLHDMRRLRDLGEELGKLAEPVRVPIILHKLGYTYADIAEIIGCSPEAARKRVTRGVAELLG